MKRLYGLEELARTKSRYIDCYISTNPEEFVSLMENAGYRHIYDRHTERPENSLIEAYEIAEIWPHHESVISPTNIRIDCIDIGLDEALVFQQEIGFIAMAKFRIYCNGNNAVENELLKIRQQLKTERQNMAFLNENYSKGFIELSEFYIPERLVLK